MRASVERMPWVEQATELGVRLDEAKAKLYEMQNAPVGSYTAEQIATQAETVNALQAQWNVAQAKVDAYDRQIEKATSDLEWNAQKAGEVAAQLADVETAGEQAEGQMDEVGEAGVQAGEEITLAMQKASNSLARIGRRILGLMRRVLFFSVITMALRGVRTWLSNVIKTDEKAVKSLNELKAAILTFAQPLVDKLIPAAQVLFDVLTKIFMVLAEITSALFGKTKQESLDAAEALYDEQQALKGVGKAADSTKKKLLSFDEINQLTKDSAESATESSGKPDFDALREDWLGNYLAGIEDKVTAGLLLGGVALIAFGAGMKKLGLVLAGIGLIKTGFTYGEENGVIGNWAQALGLDTAERFITEALLIAGFAALILGIILNNVGLILTAAVSIGAAITYGESSGALDEWGAALGLDKDIRNYIEQALIIAGIASMIVGIITGHPLLILTAAASIGAAYIYGEKSGILDQWADALGLDKVTMYIEAAVTLAAIAFVAIGVVLQQLWLVVFGFIILAGVALVGSMDQETLENWWEVLKLTRVEEWTGVAMELAGIFFVVMGAILVNFTMLFLGIGLIGYGGIVLTTGEGTYADWVEALGLDRVNEYIKSALMLAGYAFIAIGAASLNPVLVLLGLGLMGAAAIASTGSKTSSKPKSWAFVDIQPKTEADRAKSNAEDIYKQAASVGNVITFNGAEIETPEIATGAVTPATEAFSGQAAAEDMYAKALEIYDRVHSNDQKTVVLEVDGHEFGSLVVDAYNTESQRVGVALD